MNTKMDLDKVREKIEAKEKEILLLNSALQLSPNDVDKRLLVEYNITLNKLMDKEASLGKVYLAKPCLNNQLY